jgi:hypothetical protein
VRPIGEVLDATLEALGLRRSVARANAVLVWPAAAGTVLGREAVRTRALRVEGTTMVVAVESPVLAQELRLRQGDLLCELARLAPDGRVRALRFVPR